MSNWQAYQDYLRWYLKYEGDDPLTYEEVKSSNKSTGSKKK